jgi:hypothetical protein
MEDKGEDTDFGDWLEQSSVGLSRVELLSKVPAIA